ncbi:ester cyclase [Microdochium nivale]|nr:ester cyclase [Microdochium nivale]
MSKSDSASSHREYLSGRMDRFLEFINSGDESIAREVVSESAEFHVPFGGPPLSGIAGYMEILGMMRSAYPDIRWSLEETIIEGDKVFARFTISGTHQGDFLGTPATGKQISSQAFNIYKFADGKIVAERGLPDIFGMMAQIGAIAIPGPPAS